MTSISPKHADGATGATTAAGAADGSRSAASSSKARGRGGFSEMLRGLGANAARSGEARGSARSSAASADAEAAGLASAKRQKDRVPASARDGDPVASDWSRNTQELASSRSDARLHGKQTKAGHAKKGGRSEADATAAQNVTGRAVGDGAAAALNGTQRATKAATSQPGAQVAGLGAGAAARQVASQATKALVAAQEQPKASDRTLTSPRSVPLTGPLPDAGLPADARSAVATAHKAVLASTGTERDTAAAGSVPRRPETAAGEAANRIIWNPQATNADAGGVDSGKPASNSIDSGAIDSGAMDGGAIGRGKYDSSKFDSGKIDSSRSDVRALDATRLDTAKLDDVRPASSKLEPAQADGAVAEGSKLGERLLASQLVASALSGDKSLVDGGARRRADDLISIDRSGAGRVEAARSTDGLASVSAAGDSDDSDPVVSSRKDAGSSRRLTGVGARSGSAEGAVSDRGSSPQSATGATSTMALASAEGAAMRAVAERESAAAPAPQHVRAQDVTLQAAATSTLPTTTPLGVPAGVPVVVVQPAVTDPAFAQALGQQVSLLVSGEINMAEMVVTPPEMGPVRIELSVRGDKADVVFTAAAPETLKAIEASGEVLKSLLAERGISLGSMDVGQGQAQSSSGSLGDDASHRQHASGRPTTAGQAEADVESTVRTASAAVHRRGIVDLLA